MSNLKLNKIIVHELIKKKNKPLEPSNYRAEVLDPESEVVVKLVEGVVKAYGTRKNSSHYGIFEANKVFPQGFKKYSELSDSPTDSQFIEISKTAMSQLELAAQNVTLATGGYILFGDYESAGDRFFLVAMIKQTPGLAMSENLEPEELLRLDLDKLHQAARVNFTKLSEYEAASDNNKKTINYLSFISPASGQATAGYFVTALGCSAGSTSAQATKTVLDETKKYFLGNEELKPLHDGFRKDLLNYFRETAESGESVTLSALGKLVHDHIPLSLAEDSESMVDELIATLNSEEFSVPAEFPVNKRAMHSRTHIKGIATNWTVELERQAIGNTASAPVFYNEAEKKLVLREVPNDVIEMIEKELMERAETD